MNLKNLFIQLSEQIKIEYNELAENIPHHGERGVGREQILKQLLLKFLPDRFGIDSGFIIDVHGKSSRQVDLIIYDRFMGPRFKLAGNQYAYPCEIVVAAGEVKTNLQRSELSDAIDKLKVISRLDRSGGGRNRVRMGYQFAMNNEYLDHVNNACDAIWTFIFASGGTKLDTLSKNFIQLCQESEKHLWPNLVCILNAGIVSYTSDTGLITDPRKANSVYYTLESDAPYALTKWFMLLSESIYNCHISAVDIINYLQSGQSYNAKIPIPPRN